ncbi:hypothetical protein H0H81_007261 [Sphagnurus paluster]|uniref:Glycoside hydrolase family 3 N-terminal domain-containing protein n=1 Tax=Sphagnurus paluster TaxID=117069 RepID=A0A9P7GL69_9AGAR|nr:hypothetical protein H0H81_007261 [Sphagnurus paluster]
MPTLTDEVKREIGQHFVFGFHGHEVSDEIRTLIREYYVGSVILMKRNVRDAKQVRRVVQELQRVAKEAGHERPLLVGIDQENGLVSAFSSPTAGTQFPGAMALAASGDAELAFEVSAATARELKMVGVNWVYSPVADVNSDSRNPVIDPADVARFASAVARGHVSGGVAPCGKHFPGHGDTHVDSHVALPVINKSKDALQATELVPFAALVGGADPIPSIMVGHMALPGLTGDNTPASLARGVTRELLRGEMGYEGVVVTDCLEMSAIADAGQGGCGVEEAAVRALEAGVDVVMACHTFGRHVGALEAVYRAVESGRLGLEELKEGGRRVGRMKEVYVGGWDDVLTRGEGWDEEWRALKRMNGELSKVGYRKSLKVMWGGDKLPMRVEDGKAVMVFTPAMESVNAAVDDKDDVGTSYAALAEAVQGRHVVYSASSGEVEGICDDIGGVIFVLRNADRSAWQREYMQRVLGACGGIPVVLLASCGPYDLVGQEHLADRTAYVASFEFTREALLGFASNLIR